MSIIISQSHELMKEALNYRAQRQDMIASNIANADTPFYRPRDISFEEMLAEKKEKIFSKETPTLEMATTNSAHLQRQSQESHGSVKLFFRDGHMARNDGNSVDLDVETTEMSKNSVMFNALVASVKKSTNIFRSVIDASSKV
jgi:flagellar basal-body rod protein FlgB